MNKAYNIIEAVNMPTGTEFEVKFNDGYKNMFDNKMMVCKDDDGYKSLVWPAHEKGVTDGMLINAKFYKIPKAITFKEAVESGKKVRITRKISVLAYPDEAMLKDDLNEYETGKYVSLSEMLGILYWCIPWSEINNIFKEKCWLIEED